METYIYIYDTDYKKMPNTIKIYSDCKGFTILNQVFLCKLHSWCSYSACSDFCCSYSWTWYLFFLLETFCSALTQTVYLEICEV